MAYIDLDYINRYLDAQAKDQIRRAAEGADALQKGIDDAIEIVRETLKPFYDIDSELEPGEGGGSPHTILQDICAKIAIWRACTTCPGVTVDNKLHYNYEEARKQLEEIRKGNLLTDLPAYEDEDELPEGLPKYGSNEDLDVTY